jgi:hypothetical protein
MRPFEIFALLKLSPGPLLWGCADRDERAALPPLFPGWTVTPAARPPMRFDIAANVRSVPGLMQDASPMNAAHGEWHFEYPDGMPKAVAARSVDEEPDGQCTFFYEDGKKAAEGQCVRGVAEGPWTYWHPNGQRWFEGTYRQGALDGRVTLWFDDGTVQAEASFEGGLPDGLWRRYHPDGRLEQEGRYARGVRQPGWKRFT